MHYEERACHFDCDGDMLYGIVSLPRPSSGACTQAIVMLVGGAQYRAGSHRQFTLLARFFAAQGIAVLRFDYRGMGDSEGQPRHFEEVREDIRCAIDALMRDVPGISQLSLWGLCDGASAALLYAPSDTRVTGLVLANPWVRTESTLAQTYLKHYYASHFLSKALWCKILRGQFNFLAAIRSFRTQLRQASQNTPATSAPSLPDRLQNAYQQFTGAVLLVLCGEDLTAREFADLAKPGSQWQALMQDPRTERFEVPQANHTFSHQLWRQQIAQKTVDWMQEHAKQNVVPVKNS